MSEHTLPTRQVLVHYAEIGLKGGNRARFERRLLDRLREALGLAGLKARVTRHGARVLVRPPATGSGVAWGAKDLERVLAVVTRVPGVANALPVEAVRPEMDAIAAAAAEALDRAPPGSFKVETRRGDKAFPLTSIQVSQAAAPACLERTGRAVDVHRPDVTVRIEITPEAAYVSARKVRGPGGLPVGSAGRLLSLLSGGLDSAVAAWLLLRRGARVAGLHFHNRTLQGRAVLEKLEDLCGVLAWSAGRMPLLVVPFEECQRAIVAGVPSAYRMLVYRRAMFRIGARLARREKALGFVTGDSLGQVASQTAENLRTIQAATTLPVYAPLIGSDKAEIVTRAREIGTYEISTRPHADCCSFLVARHPATRSTVAELEAMEEAVDWEPLVERAVEGAERLVFDPDPAVLEDGIAQGTS